MSQPLTPPAALGMLGNGQLGRMFAQAAATMGYDVVVLAPDAEGPANHVSRFAVASGYTDELGLSELAGRVKAVSTEFENVPGEALERLAQAGVRTAPCAAAVTVTQNRWREKSFIASCGVPVADFAHIVSEADLDVDDSLFPGILKTASLGYDGKGQVRVESAADLPAAWASLGRVECVLEKRLALKKEVSVIVARNDAGEVATFPVCENRHVNGILAVTVMPARIEEAVAGRARECARTIAEKLGYVGVLCVEFFVLEGERLVVNELAPRPHNSGHATIEACECSQFEAQVRTMAGLPLGSTAQRVPAVMLNLLGDVWFDEENNIRDPDWAGILAIEGVHLHLYGKAQARRARKMGHVTVTAPSLDVALERARRVAVRLGIPGPQ